MVEMILLFLMLLFFTPFGWVGMLFFGIAIAVIIDTIKN